MIDSEERESIINEAVERMFKVLPETIGNLMKSQATYAKLNREFYSANPEFLEYKMIAAQVIAKVEGQDPLKPYEDILKQAKPEIVRQIKLAKELGVKDPAKDVGQPKYLSLSDNGAL